MTRHPFGALVVSVIGLMGFPVTLLADEQSCSIHVPNTAWVVADCHKEGSVEVLKLLPANVPLYGSEFDKLPTVIVAGSNPDEVLRKVGLGAANPYNNLIELPGYGAITRYSDAAGTAKAKVMQEGWKLLDMKDIQYVAGRESDGEGYSLVCSTFERVIGQRVVVVSQCNDFYEEDVSRLKNILRSLEG
ncbi:hypothetical protein [Pseudomonas purpurea]|uniref:hypothetical protein n=1 Tax=Pseudomonas purpurea TaxID=3136737 RepID=UPI003262ED51